MHDTILQGMTAACLLEERRAEAARERLVAGLCGRGHGMPDPRAHVGRLLIRVGSQLAGTPEPGRHVPYSVA